MSASGSVASSTSPARPGAGPARSSSGRNSGVRAGGAERRLGKLRGHFRELGDVPCADMPTISIRSGMSRATLAALWPMEPVAPRMTTRRSSLVPTPKPAAVKKQQRRGEEQAVDQVERPADAGQHFARVLHIGAPFDDRLRQIADDRGETEQTPRIAGVQYNSGGSRSRHQLKHAVAAEHREADRAKKSLPGFLGLMCGTSRCLPHTLPTTYAPMSLNFVTTTNKARKTAR